LIAEGRRLLDRASTGTQLSSYHLEAGIAALHADAPSTEETDWQAIVSLYDVLMNVEPSPVVALNRAIAIAECDGPTEGLEQISRIADSRRLSRYPYFFAAIAELKLRIGQFNEAQEYFYKALDLAQNPAERSFFLRRIETSSQQQQSR